MIRLSARLLAAPIAVAAFCAVPFAAQAQSETFTLPTATPTPTPAPAGPADERAGVAVPPRAQPTALPTATPEPRPTVSPSPSPAALATPILQPPPSPASSQRAPVVPPNREGIPVDRFAALDPEPATPPGAAAAVPSSDPLPSSTALPLPDAGVPEAATPALGAAIVPAWWPWAAGGLAGLALLGGAAFPRRRKAKPQRLTAPLAATARPDTTGEQPRLDLTLDIISATRSVMMFTVEYRLTIANRSERAVTDINAAVQLACARANTTNASSPGAAQGLTRIDRVGPHQARSIIGQVQLPLTAIAPLRQGTTPLFIPLVHVTLEGAGLRALDRSFVIGTPSASGAGRVHPILLDQPPGAVPGLVAQPIAIPPISNAA